MNFGKKIILINSIIIVSLALVIVIAAFAASLTVLNVNVQNELTETVSMRAKIISERDGVIPDDFEYRVGGVYLSVYYSDGTLKNGAAPGNIDLPINTGVISTVTIDGSRYYVYDFAVSLSGRNDIYLRGIISTAYGSAAATVILVAFIALLVAGGAIIFNLISVKKAVKPISEMEKEVLEIGNYADLSRRITVPDDPDLSELAKAYNFMLESLKKTFDNHERFTSDVAHELRTPLTVILSESEYALEETTDEAERAASLGVINRQTKRLVSITNGLLEFTRYANKIKAELENIDISSITRDYLRDYCATDVNIHCEAENQIIISGNKVMYERVLQNLCDNAVKYGKPNGNVYVKVENKGDAAVLSVKDDGIGMSKEELEHVYDRFYRADASRSQKSGLGLGLSLVKEMIRLLGATIDIQSEKGVGTAVYVTFPSVK